jgi:hypothetical protein
MATSPKPDGEILGLTVEKIEIGESGLEELWLSFFRTFSQ